ncbi:MAG: hypothetical protein L6367_08150 [Cellulomonas sp.]|nr:hypothetical protein [Cellulomonas sp.]
MSPTPARHRLRAALTGALVAVCAIGLAAPAQATAPTHRSGSCSLPVGRTTLTVTSGGLDRTAVVYRPATRTTRLPVVLDLHGSGSTSVEQLDRSGLEKTADSSGFLVVAPQGAIVSGTGYSWNVPHVTTAADAPDDEAFLSALIDTLVATGCVDATRVYATGYSGGGRMISQYACDVPGRLAAIAPVAGLRAGAPSATDASTVDTSTCAPAQGTSVLTFHGTADPVNWYDGGGLFPYWGYSATTALSRWAEIDGCRRGPSTRQVSGSVSLVTYSGCTKGTSVAMYVVADGGHTWPGSTSTTFPAVLGTLTQEIDASSLMWRFFSGHRCAR